MIDHLSDPGSWAETLALFPHPYLKVSDHTPRHNSEALEPRRDSKPAAALADDAPLAPPGVVRELCDPAVHVAANTTETERHHG